MSGLFMLMLFVAGTGASRQGDTRSVKGDGWMGKFLTRDGTDFWNLDAKSGLVLQATVHSTEFDPTIQLVRLDKEQEVSMLEKDDEGSTSTFTHRLEHGGKFQIRIYAFKHSGGGNYRLQINRFLTAAMRVGNASAGQFDKQGQAAFRFTGTKGDILSFNHRGPVQRVQFFMESLVPVSTWSNTLFVPASGIYYVRLSGPQDKRFEFELQKACSSELSLGHSQSITMSPRKMRVFEFSANTRASRCRRAKCGCSSSVPRRENFG